MVPCGEFADRKCGVNGSTCRQRQNSVTLLSERLGRREGGADGPRDPAGLGGCTVADGSAGIAMALAMLGLRRHRR